MAVRACPQSQQGQWNSAIIATHRKLTSHSLSIRQVELLNQPHVKGGNMIRGWGREVRYAVRLLRRSPGVTLLSVITMGAGIGVSTILFAMVNSIVLRPLPYPGSEQLVRICDVNPRAGISRTGVSTGNLYDWQRVEAFDGVAGYYAMGRTVSFDTDSEVLISAQVSRDFFKVLQVTPEIGRAFTEDETQRATFNSAAAPTGADPVV